MSKSILVVDDSEAMRLYMREFITHMGFNCVLAKDGVEALQKIPYHSIKLIITDLYMPNMDGFTFIENVKKMDRYKFIPILFLSSDKDIKIRIKAKKAGATGWLNKPVKKTELERILLRLIR